MERQGSYEDNSETHGPSFSSPFIATIQMYRKKGKEGERVTVRKGTAAFHGDDDCGPDIFPPFSTR